MDVADFDFSLPDELIAQDPPPERGHSRLLVTHRDTGRLEDSMFFQLPEHLRSGDLLVLNDTRVFPARLIGRREPSGGAVECLLLRQFPTPQLPTSNSAGTGSAAPDDADPQNAHPGAGSLGMGRLGVGSSGTGSSVWEALVHPGQKLKPGAMMLFERDGATLRGEVLGRHFHGRRTVRLWTDDGTDASEAVERIGHVPLPPYIKRDDRPADKERYQTVYARTRGSIAAPTAGLHFTPAILEALAHRGIERAEVTLHVGYGTFKPIRSSHVEAHVVDPESFVVGSAAADAITRARRERRRVIAVGTTTVRVLESLGVGESGEVEPTAGETALFIRPGHQFRLVDGLLTNFHLPRSSLFVLVCAFAGRSLALEAYQEAIERGYRFYSYGDAMLVL